MVEHERIDGAWERFCAEHDRELTEWLTAAAVLESGHPRGRESERLLIAEAVLQSAIFDFAVTDGDRGDPAPLALGLLRRAEAMLEPG